MKKTTTRNLKTKITAAIMALVSMASTTTVIMHPEYSISRISVSAAEFEPGLNINDDKKITLSETLESVEKITVETIFKVLEECTTYGKLFTPALQGVLDMVIGDEPDPALQKLDDISDKIDKLFDKIDQAEDTIIASVQTDIGLSDFYNAYVDFKSKTEKMARNIRDIKADTTLSNPDKLAKIGSLAGNFYEWDNKFDDSFEKVTKFYKKVSLSTQKNIFETIYDRNCQISMFSGEAMDKSKELCNLIMQTYSAGCSTILEVLSAQLYVNSLESNTIETIDNEYLSHICRKSVDIMNEINNVSEALIGKQNDNGFEGKGEIANMLNDTFSKPRNILVNEGHGTPIANLQTTLFNQDIKQIPSVNDDSKNEKIRAQQQADWFNNNVYNGQLDLDTIKAITKYAAKYGKTVRTLLNENGFDTSNLPDNCYLITGNAWGDSTFYLAAEHGWAYFKGVNIDDTSCSEQQVKFWDVGWTGVFPFQDRWNFAEEGNACRFQCQ